MTTTSEAPGLVEQLDPAALALAVAALEPAAPEAPAPAKQSSRKSVLALSVCALAINGAAAIYTLPADLPSLSVGSLAELLPRREASAPKADPVAAALKDIQSTQQQHTASLQESNRASQQNAALLQQDSMVLLSLRQSITDERVDVRKISSQLSTLIAKVDTLQNAMMSDVTSSIRKANARYGLSAAMRKRIVRQSKSVGPVSVGGAPLSVPATVSAPES
ncbi:outer membrane murein-binding lipoprotein Lpp [Bradyrhizobium japonicum USDA 38]|nr:outer membrane murein-binding lipoprotein Lpp [Bradyrhizobium japonicum USDA 38]MCS3948540.1 outer membrane murein-binding lipoprotein Lpp [Bradyrhizobium japonicum]MCW2218635.1 outer membrane murein-binding lipoprotein Lpp [Bradyrhizobium japonicum]MCW2343249.1 outer membrane murein-binding lipoprotein Lpp [Bradyrhizobium japonicum]